MMPQADLIESEIAGSIRTRKAVFETAWIKKLEERAKSPIQLDANMFTFTYSFIDPSGGGTQSDLAIITIAILPSKNVVVLGMSRDANPNEVWLFLISSDSCKKTNVK